MRMTPMCTSSGDEKSLRDSILGHPSYMEHIPMFFTSEGANINIEGTYKGSSCFLISNGPSVSSLDLQKLRQPGVMIIALNNGATTLLKEGITPNFWVCVDDPCRFVKQIWLNPGIQKFVPMGAFEKPLWDNEKWEALNMKVKDCPNILGFRRNEKFAAHRFLTESNFNWGCHQKYGGCRTVLMPALRIPFLLGFRTLYLLGVDLNMDTNNKYHFDEGRTKGAINCNNKTYDRIISEYAPGVKKYADRFGYKIFNCNKDSKLTCFPHIPYDKAVESATSICGPTDEISTKGMYTIWDEKQTMTREDAINKTHG